MADLRRDIYCDTPDPATLTLKNALTGHTFPDEAGLKQRLKCLLGIHRGHIETHGEMMFHACEKCGNTSTPAEAKTLDEMLEEDREKAEKLLSKLEE